MEDYLSIANKKSVISGVQVLQWKGIDIVSPIVSWFTFT